MGSGVPKQQKRENNTEGNPKAPCDKNRRDKQSIEFFLKEARGTDYDFYGAHGIDKSRSVTITNFDGDISKLERYFQQKYPSDFKQANYDWDVIVEFKSRQVAESVVKGVHKVEGTTLKITLDSKHMTKGGTVRKEQDVTAIDDGTKEDGHLYPFGEICQVKMAGQIYQVTMQEGWKTQLLMRREVMEDLLLEIIKATAKSVILEVEEEWRLGQTVPDEYDKQISYEILASSPVVQSVDLPAGCNLSIPPGATDEDTSVISAVLNPHGYEGTLQLENDELLVSDIVEMRPSGMIFSKPVKLKIPHSLPKFDKERDYVVMTSEDDGTTWETLRTLSHQEKGQAYVMVEVAHFSSFTVVARPLEHCHRVRKGQASELKSSKQTGIKMMLPKDCLPSEEEISFKVIPVDKETLTCAGKEDRKMGNINTMSHIVRFFKGSNLLLNSRATIVLPLSQGEGSSKVRVLSCDESGNWKDITNKVDDVILKESKVAFKTKQLSSGFTVLRCDKSIDPNEIVALVAKNTRVRRVRTVIFKKWKEPREDGVMTARMECVLEEMVDDRICHATKFEGYERQEGTPTPTMSMMEDETFCALFYGSIRPNVKAINTYYGVNFKFYCNRPRILEFDVTLVDKGRGATSEVRFYPGRREIYHPCVPGEKEATPLATAEISAPTGVICDYWLACQRFKNTLGIEDPHFSPDHDKCYCEKCHRERGDPDSYHHGNPQMKYAVPVGWSRFGLTINAAFKEKKLNVFTDWHRAYHGTPSSVVKEILQTSSQLLMPGDVKFGGDSMGKGKGFGFDSVQVFLSPSIKYSGLDIYAQPTRFHDDFDGREYTARVAFQVCTRPGSYDIMHETVGATKKGITIDPLFRNDVLEWKTKERGVHALYGLLVKLEET